MNHSREERNVSIAIIAIAAALGVLGVVVITVAVTIPLQEAEAGCERGPAVNRSFESSSGRCFNPR
jgi:hypothetical protein